MFDVSGWIDYLIDSLFNLTKKTFDAVQEFFQDVAFWVVRIFMEFGLFCMDIISFCLPTIDLNSAWVGTGSNSLAIMDYVNVQEAMTIIVCCYTIRAILNWIPLIK